MGAQETKGWQGYERRERKGREVAVQKRVGNRGGEAGGSRGKKGEITQQYSMFRKIQGLNRDSGWEVKKV